MFSKTVIVYLILYLCCVLCTRTLTPVLKVTEGRLRGLHSVLSGQNKYYGIPYAVAERFQVCNFIIYIINNNYENNKHALTKTPPSRHEKNYAHAGVTI